MDLIDSQILQAFENALDYPPGLDSKTLLLNILYIWIIKLEKKKHQASPDLGASSLLDSFQVLEGSLHDAEGEK